jgi:hypothetical protein
LSASTSMPCSNSHLPAIDRRCSGQRVGFLES